LVLAEGAAPAAGAGGKKSGERQAVEGLLNELLKVVRENKEAAAYAQKFQDKLPDATELREKLGIKDMEEAKQRALDEMTKVLEGDWTPFDTYYGPLREYGGKMLDEDPTPEKRSEWIEKAATFALDKLKQYPEIRDQINAECKPGIDLIQECLPFAKRIFRRGMDLLLDGPSAELTAIDPKYAVFSQQLRVLIVTAVGGLIDIICGCLKDGEPQCRLLMAKLTGKAVELFAEKFPDYEKLAAFVGPMAMNQVMDWFDEYKKTIKGKKVLDLVQ